MLLRYHINIYTSLYFKGKKKTLIMNLNDFTHFANSGPLVIYKLPAMGHKFSCLIQTDNSHCVQMTKSTPFQKRKKVGSLIIFQSFHHKRSKKLSQNGKLVMTFPLYDRHTLVSVHGVLYLDHCNIERQAAKLRLFGIYNAPYYHQHKRKKNISYVQPYIKEIFKVQNKKLIRSFKL